MIVRSAAPADVTAITAIYNEAVQHTTASWDLEPQPVASRQEWYDRRTGDGWPVLVAEDRGEVVGWGALGPFRDKPGYLHTGEHSVYVRLARRGSGIGSALLQALIDVARQRGLHVLVGGVSADNAGSVAFHERHGFVQVAHFREVGRKFGRWLDLVFLQLDLESAAPGEVQWFDRPGGEPVELHEPSPRWLEVADRWRADIVRVLAPLRPRVEHVGSTAVPGLLTKPVVDLQVSVPDLADEAAYRPGLESLGLVLRARERDRRFFRPPAGEPRVVHVHVCGEGSDWERDHLLFRDRLRENRDLAAAYERLKQDLVRTVGTDRFAYTEGKTDFIRRVLEAGEEPVPGSGP